MHIIGSTEVALLEEGRKAMNDILLEAVFLFLFLLRARFCNNFRQGQYISEEASQRHK